MTLLPDPGPRGKLITDLEGRDDTVDEAFVWSSKATDDALTLGAANIRCRPRATQHGVGTKTAVSRLGEKDLEQFGFAVLMLF